MEFRFVLQTLFEIAVAAFIIYGLFFEERFAEAERNLVSSIKRFLYNTFSQNNFKTYP